ncbi:MAG: arginase family protein [Saprospiraceae bacterium]|nr:arginase family protein [Saprospiraceae bacterium]
MLTNWLSPVHSALLKSFSDQPQDSFFSALGIHRGKSLPDTLRAQVALIGVEPKAANAVRRALYPLAFRFPKLKVVDLGNVRNQESRFLIPILNDLIGSGMVPVIIGSGGDILISQYLAFQELREEVSMLVVDEHIDYQQGDHATGLLNAILDHPAWPPFHVSHIGHQIHQVSPLVDHYLTDQAYDLVRLGHAKAHMQDLEPIIRNADLVSFDLSALRAGDVGAVAAPSPSGFSSEEACQICRYAGMSDKMRTFSIVGYAPTKDNHQLSAQVQAQMLWYLIDGIYHRKNDFPVTTAGMVEYIVEYKQLDYQLTFWKSKKSGRWWMQIPVKTKAAHQRHRLLPCSYQDYQKASQDEMPDRLLNALRRFS